MKENVSDTPRTDRMIQLNQFWGESSLDLEPAAEFCRELERELAEAKKDSERLGKLYAAANMARSMIHATRYDEAISLLVTGLDAAKEDE